MRSSEVQRSYKYLPDSENMALGYTLSKPWWSFITNKESYQSIESEKSKQKMISVDSVLSKYGYGFAIYKTESKGKWVYHNVSWAGIKTTAFYLPESNEYLVILSNNRYEETYSKFEADFYKLIQ